MFLFQGYFGNILYTGDFRYRPDIVNNVSVPIDILYLDNTYCSFDKNHPTREEAVETILSTIYNHPDKKIIFGMRKLGKEQLLVKIAATLKTTVKVSIEDYKKMEILNVQQYFTYEDSELSRIEVVPFDKIFVPKENAIRILPTSLIHQGKKSKDLFIVPYSDHSNFNELKQFVKQVRPQTLRPIIPGKSLEVFQAFLNPINNVTKLKEISSVSVHIPPADCTYSSSSSSSSNSRKRQTQMVSKKLLKVSKSNKDFTFVDNKSSDDDDCIVIN
ncbi:5' exonuclease Apollo, variant 2 [Chamberlinius hualienensis]